MGQEKQSRPGASGSQTTALTTGSGIHPESHRPQPAPAKARGSIAKGRQDGELVERVFRRCHEYIENACLYSSVPPAFLGALTANESGGDPRAARFEPGVYRHLKAVAEGQGTVYAGLKNSDINDEVADILHPKAGNFHPRYLTAEFAEVYQGQIAGAEDEALRELATSWGFTQIMGYHVIGLKKTPHDLLDPKFHYQLAIQLLSEFAHDFQLDLTLEFPEMFRCWNTGSPYGRTFDPDYVANGLYRAEIYRSLQSSAALPPGGLE